MRFCPFCSAENADELAVCQSCGRRLPPLPPRRARNAPATGVLLPPRAQTTTQPPPVTAPRRSSSTNPPLTTAPTAPAAPSAAMVTSAGLVPVAAATSGLRAPATAPGLPTVAPGLTATSSGLPTTAPLAPPNGPPTPTPPGLASESSRALAQALSPGPAAQRRGLPPSEPPDPGASARRRSDLPLGPPVPATPSRPMPNLASGARPATSILPSAIPSPPPSSNAGPRPGLYASPAPATDPPWASNPPRAPSLLGEPAARPQPPALPPPVVASDQTAPPFGGAARRRGDDRIEPPPTRIHRPEALADRPFTPPQVSPVPEIPEPGLVNSARYAMRFAKARWQRRGAIRVLGGEIKNDTDALDQVLGALGGVARTAKVDGRVFSGENAAITTAEQRAEQMTREHNEVDARKLEENSKFVDVERERNAKLGEAERLVEEAQKELAQLETQRRGLRDKRKELERRQKAYLKAAEDSEKQTGGSTEQGGDTRQELRRAAEQHRREAAALEPERQEVDRRLAAIERPINESTAKLDAAKAELDAAKRSLSDAREGHTHRLAELDAEQKRKAREIAQAQGEIARRLVTLGTLVNLNRIEDPQFAELYDRIDRLRGAITARTTEIEKLTAEREAYDRGNLVRGIATIGGAIILFIALIVILRAALSH